MWSALHSRNAEPHRAKYNGPEISICMARNMLNQQIQGPPPQASEETCEKEQS